MLEKRRAETKKRAEAQARKVREAKEKERKQAEEERKMRKEIRTGGGFNIDKLKALRAKGINI